MQRTTVTKLFALVMLLATVWTPPEASAQTPTARRPSLQRATDLCRQGDKEQHRDELAAARAHLESGLAALGSLETPAARRVRLSCGTVLAGVLQAQGDRRGAWAQMRRAFTASVGLPASAWAGFESSHFELARHVWGGARCAEGLDRAQLVEGELSTLQALGRFDDAGVRACLGALRTRLRQEGGGVCRTLAAPPSDVRPFAPGAKGWTAVDADTGVNGRGEEIVVALRARGALRYVSCEVEGGEVQMEVAEGRWVLPGAALVLTSRIRPCGEDGDARRCPPETLALVLNGEGTLLGSYTLVRSAQSDHGPLATPFGEVRGAEPFRAEGGALRIGTRTLRVVGDALANTP